MQKKLINWEHWIIHHFKNSERVKLAKDGRNFKLNKGSSL